MQLSVISRHFYQLTVSLNVYTFVLQEREASVSHLLAEVEVLRARKIVVQRYLNEREGEEEGKGQLEEKNRRLEVSVWVCVSVVNYQGCALFGIAGGGVST